MFVYAAICAGRLLDDIAKVRSSSVIIQAFSASHSTDSFIFRHIARVCPCGRAGFPACHKHSSTAKSGMDAFARFPDFPISRFPIFCPIRRFFRYAVPLPNLPSRAHAYTPEFCISTFTLQPPWCFSLALSDRCVRPSDTPVRQGFFFRCPKIPSRSHSQSLLGPSSHHHGG